MTMQQYQISSYLTLAEFVDNVIHKQQTTLPASCNNVDVSLDRLLMAQHIHQANIDVKAYIAAITSDSGISPADQDNLRKSLIEDLKKISHGVDNIKIDGAYPATVTAFQPWQGATDNLVMELGLQSRPVSLSSDLTSMQRQLDTAASTYNAFLGAGYPRFTSSLDKAGSSFTAYNNAYNIPGFSTDALSSLKTKLVDDLNQVQNNGKAILTMLGDWVKETNDPTKINVVVSAASIFVQDTTATPLPGSFPTDLKNLGDALTFEQNFVESKYATLDLSNLISICVGDIMLAYLHQ